MDHMASVSLSVGQFVCVGLWLLGDGDVMEIKGCGWVRFKPIYCRSVHSSRSRGKP